MPERVDRGVCGAATPADHARDGLLEGSGRERRLLGPSGEPPGPGARPLPGDPQPLQGPCRQGHHAVLAPWTLAAADQQALGGDGRDLPRRPFPEAQPTRSDSLQTHAGFRALDQGPQGTHCLRTQHDGQGLAVPGRDAFEDRPRALPRPLGEAPDPSTLEAARALGDLLLSEPGEEVVPECRFAHGIGRTSVVVRQVLAGFEIAWLGAGGQASAVAIVQPPASERRQGHPPVRGKHRGSKRSTRSRKINGRSA